MSARDGSRLGALPSAGYRPTPRLAADGRPVIRFVPEDPGSAPMVFDFSTWPVSLDLQRALAQALAWRIRPAGSVRAARSADKSFRVLRRFATYLGGLHRPPHAAAELTPAQLKGWFLSCKGNAAAAFVRAQEASVPDTATLQTMAARFAPTEIGADLSKLSANDRRVLAKEPVAMQLDEVREAQPDVVERERAFVAARDLQTL